MLNEKQSNFHPVPVFWMQVRKCLLQSCKRMKYYFFKCTSLISRRSLNNIRGKQWRMRCREQQVMNEIQTILCLFTFPEWSQNCTILLYLREAPLQSQIHQHAINQYKLYPRKLLWKRCKTLTVFTRYIRTHPLVSCNF